MSNGNTALGVLRDDLKAAIDQLSNLPAPVDCPNSGTPGALRVGMKVLLRVQLGQVERDIAAIGDQHDIVKQVITSVLKYVAVAVVAAVIARLV